jgi:protein-tyrosine phosphatase
MDFIPTNLNALYSRLQSESEITRDNFMIVSEVRSKPSEILLSPSVKGRLYLSGRQILHCYQSYNIEHIVSIVPMRNPSGLDRINHDILSIDDRPDSDTIRLFESRIPSLCESIHKSLTEGKNVGVHCQVGVSRSVTLVLAYLMKYEALSLKEAVERVKSCRPFICPNRGFLEILGKLEREQFQKSKSDN